MHFPSIQMTKLHNNEHVDILSDSRHNKLMTGVRFTKKVTRKIGII